MTPRPTIYILDAYSLIYQNFHGVPLMTGPAGQPTNAVFGMFRDLLAILKSRKPDYLAAAFDGAGKTKRAEEFAEYKAQRGPMPGDMVPQIPVIRRMFEAFKVPVLLHPGAEADDIIATLARRATERGLDAVICTSDKDARQLLDAHTRILNLRKNEFLDVEGLKLDWGVTPEQVVDTLTLTGDSVDNVPGVPGIGLKTAVALLQEFGTLDNLMLNIDKVSGAKRKENLRNAAETVKRGRSLIKLEEDLPLELDWDHLKSDGYDAKALRSLCLESGFHRFLDEIVDTSKPVEVPWEGDYRTIDTPEALQAFAAELAKRPRFCGRHRDHLDRPPAGRAGRALVLVGGRRRLLPAGPGADGRAGPRPGEHDRGPPPRARKPRDREGRPEHQVRHARAPPLRRRHRRAGDGHDGPELPPGIGRAEPLASTSFPSACSRTR